MQCRVGFFSLFLAFSTVATAPAIAGIALDSTRIVYLESDKQSGKSIQVSSSALSNTPYLVKIKITRDIHGQRADTPFIVTPSLFRLIPGSENQVRILKKPSTLPQDRESLFYFHAVAIPTASLKEEKDKSKLGGSLQLASSNIIKLFYRPNGLSPGRDKAAEKLQLIFTAQGLKLTNPTPYYLTLSDLSINGKTVNIRSVVGENMIAPFSDTTFTHARTKGVVSWQVINDYGGMETFNGSLQ